jgi:hypothetical protein
MLLKAAKRPLSAHELNLSDKARHECGWETMLRLDGRFERAIRSENSFANTAYCQVVT